jgi:ATP-dependent Clp protease ATP-binding subunit ClpB
LADLILEDKIGEGSVAEFDVIDNEVIISLN